MASVRRTAPSPTACQQRGPEQFSQSKRARQKKYGASPDFDNAA